MNAKYRYQWYQNIYENISKIHEEACRYGEELGIAKLDHDIGMYAGTSSRPGNLPNYVLDEIIAANRGGRTLTLREVEDQVREVIKDVYGDEYDAAVANTCEAALRIAMETLVAPPALRRGEAYRSRFLMLYGEDYEWMGGYGRAFPPKYKNLLVDRTVAAGELGVEGKSLANLEALYVRFAGAKYDSHGIRFNPTALLANIDVEGTFENVKKVAARHAELLSGVSCIGYDTPSYGYSQKDDSGVPTLKRLLGELAREYDVPFIVDNASCLPVIGMDPRLIGADIMTYSMDKAGRAPTCGLIIGREEVMNPIRKGMGLGGQRYGELSSHGKAVFTFSDAGRDAMVGLLAYLKVLRDSPQLVIDPIDKFHEVIEEEFQSLEPARFREKLIFTKSYHLGGTELNYEQTWDGDGFGIPIFTLEDLWANTNPIVSAQVEMGVEPATIYSGNMFLGPGLGTLDLDGNLIEEYARLAAKSLVKAVEIVCEYAGLSE